MQATSLPIILKQNRFLLIGAGAIASQKADVLTQNQLTFTVIAQENIANLDNVTLKNVNTEDCEGYDVVIDATGSDSVRDIVFSAKAKYNFLLNRVDVPEDCDFYFASIAHFGEMKIAVSSNGASPTIAKEVRAFIERIVPKKLTQLLAIKKEQRAQKIIEPNKTKEEVQSLLGHVYLIGCGIGDVELLTLKAYRLIQEMDVVFVDHLISQEIIDIIPSSVEQIYVGKQKDKLVTTQEAINNLLLEYAKKGLRVARLKSGDPYIFGRGAEEAIHLAKEGIRVDVVPGISSAIAGPLSAGIAPTARGYSANLSIVTAHLRDNRINLDWIEILKMKNHTTIVLMAVSRADEIVKKALEVGVDKNLATAVISNASRPNQVTKITTLQNLAEIAHHAPRPALIMFGDVINLHGQLPINCEL